MEVDQTVQISLLVGFLLPTVLSVFMQSHWSANLKNLIAFAACVVAGGVTVVASGEFDAANWFTSGLAVLVASKTTYETFWHPTNIAPTIESKTNVANSGEPSP